MIRATVHYFAYGSNMSVRRLQARIPVARCLGAASLASHELRFHKSGRDGSGKCDAFFTDNPEDSIHGVLFEIDVISKQRLDRIEGLGRGYDEKKITVRLPDGDHVAAMTYVATRIDTDLRPFSWYKAHVVFGARYAGLPRNYLDRIVAVPAHQDFDRARHRREMAVYEHTAL